MFVVVANNILVATTIEPPIINKGRGGDGHCSMLQHAAISQPTDPHCVLQQRAAECWCWLRPQRG